MGIGVESDMRTSFYIDICLIEGILSTVENKSTTSTYHSSV
jgi:hypothetical protein